MPITATCRLGNRGFLSAAILLPDCNGKRSPFAGDARLPISTSAIMLIWAPDAHLIADGFNAEFPIVLNDDGESRSEIDPFPRHYTLCGATGSESSSPKIGRAMCGHFSFRQENSSNWRDAEHREQNALHAAYRDFCMRAIQLAKSITCQYLYYDCSFDAFALRRNGISRLPYTIKERRVRCLPVFHEHVNVGAKKAVIWEVMTRGSDRISPRILATGHFQSQVPSIDARHQKIMVRPDVRTGFRSEEIETFSVKYIYDPARVRRPKPRIRLDPDPYDGSGMQTKGQKVRDTHIARRLITDPYQIH